MATKIQIIFYSMYGHTYRIAEAIAEGARTVGEIDIQLFRVPELVSDDILEKSGAKAAQAALAHIPLISIDTLAQADAYIFGTPTRFGNMCAQMRHFFDQLNHRWAKEALAGKIGSVFASTSTQYGSPEATLTNFHSTLFHLGMIIASAPGAKGLSNKHGMDASLLTEVKRTPSDTELAIARQQGKHVAEIARALNHGRIRHDA